MKTVYLVENLAEEPVKHECEDLLEFLKERFVGHFPENGRIYNASFSQDHDVTPQCEADIKALAGMEGPFYVTLFPQDGLSLGAIIAIEAATTAIFALAFLGGPSDSRRNIQGQSPQNSLSDRSNRARPNARIPDIFGQVRFYR